MTRMREYQVKRRIPWSISPRFSNGFRTYSLLSVQVLPGDGKSLETVWLTTCQSTTATANPSSGRTNQSNFIDFIESWGAVRVEELRPAQHAIVHPFRLWTANPFAYAS